MKEYLNHILESKPQIGITASVTGAVMPFIDTLTKFAQCGAALTGFIIGAWTLYLQIKKHRSKNGN